MKKFILSLTISTFFFLTLPGTALGVEWSDWYVPVIFEGLPNDYGSWADPTNVATLDNLAWMRGAITFGNPAPEKWCKGFGFYLPDLVGREISEIEVEIVSRKLYGTQPHVNMEVFISKDEGTPAQYLNAFDTNFYALLTNTSWQTNIMFWRDAVDKPWVSNYFPFFQSDSLEVYVCGELTSTSGSTNFLDVSQLQLRVNTGATTASETIPQQPTELQLSIEQLQDTLQARAPFAYFYAVSDFDFSSVDSEDLLIQFPVPYPTGTVVYEATVSAQLKSVLGGIRTVTGIAIIGLTVLYLVGLGDRLL